MYASSKSRVACIRITKKPKKRIYGYFVLTDDIGRKWLCRDMRNFVGGESITIVTARISLMEGFAKSVNETIPEGGVMDFNPEFLEVFEAWQSRILDVSVPPSLAALRTHLATIAESSS